MTLGGSFEMRFGREGCEDVGAKGREKGGIGASYDGSVHELIELCD